MCNSIWLLCAIITASCGVRASNNGTVHHYRFVQSINPSYSPAITTINTLSHAKNLDDWQSWELQFGRGYQATEQWHNALKRVNTQHYPQVYAYLDRAGKEALAAPCCFDCNGQLWFADFHKKQTLSFFPHFFVDEQALASLCESEVPWKGIAVPLVRYDAKACAIYDQERTKKMERLEKHGKEHIFEDASGAQVSESLVLQASPDYHVQYGYNVTLRSFYPSSKKPFTRMPLHAPGLDDQLIMTARYQEGIKELAYWPDGQYYAWRHGKRLTLSSLGMYVLLLRYYGCMQAGHDALTEQMRQCLDASWGAIDKNGVLELKIAEILRNDAVLCEQARRLVDLGPWQPYATYTAIRSACNEGLLRRSSDGAAWYDADVVSDYMPTEEYFLAFHITNIVRLLWYALFNESLFYKESLPKVSSAVSQAWVAIKNLTVSVADWSAGRFKKMVYKTHMINNTRCSFIKLWKELLTRITLNDTKTKHYLIASCGDVLVYDPAYTKEVLKKHGIHDGKSTWESFKAQLALTKTIKILHDMQCCVISGRYAYELNGPDVRVASPVPQS